MPVTPFHGGIGLLCKGVAPRSFSFTLFCATQVAIDLEPAYYFLLRDEWPFHRLFHTLGGASLVAFATAFALRPVATRALSAFWRGVSTRLPGWIDADPGISLRAAAMAAMAGVIGHLVPDSIMHADVRPLAPFSDANPLYGVLSLGALHLGVVLTGVLGLVILRLRRMPWRFD